MAGGCNRRITGWSGFSRDRSRTRIIAWRAARRIWTAPARLWGLTTGRWIAPGLSGFTTWDAPDKWTSCLRGGTMKTPKCPLCGTPLKAIRGYDVHGITTDWVAGCYNCFFQSSHFWKTKKACIEDMDRLVSLFPPIMRVWPGDKLQVEDGSICEVINVNKNLAMMDVRRGEGRPVFTIADTHVIRWPWELEQEGGAEQ